MSRLSCSTCGVRLRNDENTLWLGPTWELRDPYCLDCAPTVERELAERGV